MSTRVFSLRADETLSAHIESQALLEHIHESQLLHKALTQYLTSTPEVWLRRLFEAVLTEVLVSSHFIHLLAAQTFGHDELRDSLPEIARQARARAREILDEIDGMDDD